MSDCIIIEKFKFYYIISVDCSVDYNYPVWMAFTLKGAKRKAKKMRKRLRNRHITQEVYRKEI